MPIVGLMRDNTTYGIHECVLLVTMMENVNGLGIVLGEAFLQNFPAAFAYENSAGTQNFMVFSQSPIALEGAAISDVQYTNQTQLFPPG